MSGVPGGAYKRRKGEEPSRFEREAEITMMPKRSSSRTPGAGAVAADRAGGMAGERVDQVCADQRGGHVVPDGELPLVRAVYVHWNGLERAAGAVMVGRVAGIV